jgi:[protein-PII] uridylyltransferase
MLEIFHLALEQKADIHPQALQRITRGLHALGDATRDDPRAAKEFLAILTSKHNPERVLRLMNESGVLGRFLPDFGKIVAMMQFDMYHSYTVDEHTIQVVGILHQIESGGLARTAPVATSVMPEIESRRTLFVAAFLHDIAKGRDGDHSELGAELALEICPRLGLTTEETETVSWLVRHHLLMSKIAFRYDLNDPKTIDDFTAIVQSPERLKLLLVLTVADIRGVGPTIWNGWKAALMRDLYYQSDAVLRGADASVIAASSAEEARETARAGLPAWLDEDFAAHAARLPRNYWTGFDTEMHVRHAELSHSFRALDVPLLVDFRQVADRKVTELTLLTVDDAGLFSRVAGAVAGHGINIIGARITTCTDGTVLDVFQLQTTKNELVEDTRLLGRLKDSIDSAVTGTLRPQAALRERWQSLPARVRRLPVPSRVILSNRISSTHTVIEINGRDFPGLLHRLTQTLAELGLQIQTATVSTYGERVVDVFYVKDLFGLQIHNQARLDTIRDRLLAVFDQLDEAAA